jgi:hypothetical protein
MTTHAITLDDLRVEVARTSEAWRGRLLDPGRFAAFAKLLGFGLFTQDDIRGLWRIGLLRADLVSSDTPIDVSGLLSVGTVANSDRIAYCDARRIEHRLGGYGSSFVDADLGNAWELRFHPHRLFVLHHVQRTLKIETSITQFLAYEEGVGKVVERRIESARRWTSSVEFGERFDYWNKVAETAIVAEPFTFSIVQYGADAPDTPPEPSTTLERLVREFIVAQGPLLVHRMRGDLALAAETLDDNRAIHVLLRLMKPRERERLKGQLGGAVHLLAAAETIRRAAEAALGIRLPEEDEIGPGQWFPGARKRLYGSDRVFDAPRHVLRDYLTLLGLDFAIKTRCYVEGSTEMGAMRHAIGDLGHVQLVDLKGQVAERGGKGLAFSASLGADKKAGVFSVILLDADRDEYVRLVRRAAEEERFTGSFYIASPDFELGNFSAWELIDVAISMSSLGSLQPEAIAPLSALLAGAASTVSSNRDLFRLLATHGIQDVGKDEAWGKALMERAIAQPVFGAEDSRRGAKRPVVEAAEMVARTLDIGFLRSVEYEKVDAATGRAIPRGATGKN